MNKKQFLKLTVSVAILISGLAGSTDVSAISCTSCYKTRNGTGWGYYVCQGNIWRHNTFDDNDSNLSSAECERDWKNRGCVYYPANAQPRQQPAVIPPGC